MRSNDTLELRAAVGETIEGTWSAKGESVVMTIEGRDETLTVEGSQFVMVIRGGGRDACDHAKGEQS